MPLGEKGTQMIKGGGGGGGGVNQARLADIPLYLSPQQPLNIGYHTCITLWVRQALTYLWYPSEEGTLKICVCTGCPKKNATSYISLDFRENRKPVFIIYTLLESYISQLSTMKKSQWSDIPVGRYPPKHDTPSDVKSRATGTGLLIHKLALIYLPSPV